MEKEREPGQSGKREKQIDVLGVPVDMVDMEEAAAAFEGFLAEEGPCRLIVTPNSEIVVRAGKDPELAAVIRRADLVIPDGIGLVYASRILGCPLKERVTGIDFLNRALALLAERGGSVYLLGGKPGVAEAAGEKMLEAWPGLRLAGTHHGYFGAEEEEARMRAVAETRPELLCVAMGAPRQEKLMAAYRELCGARAAVGVGGSLDVWAGTVKRAPEFYQKHGLEWLYRIVKQPSRLKRSAALPVFMLRVLASRRS